VGRPKEPASTDRPNVVAHVEGAAGDRRLARLQDVAVAVAAIEVEREVRSVVDDRELIPDIRGNGSIRGNGAKRAAAIEGFDIERVVVEDFDREGWQGAGRIEAAAGTDVAVLRHDRLIATERVDVEGP